ncbi:MAG: hypothetical protein IPK00_17845 [Deltaproteobacteria bacterium]|nr:hypothetical protein [Deltaproteobacteria bacterium]
MKSTLAVLALGLFALVVQGALARAIAPPWCPDLAWLVVVGIGLRWPGFLSGFVISALLGFAMDSVSGSLVGQHAVLRIFSYLAAAIASRQLDLSGGIPIALLTLALSVAYGFGIVSTRAIFLGPEPLLVEVLALAVAQGFVHMVCVGPIVGLVDRIVNRFADEELSRRGSLALGYSSYPGRGRS